MPYKFHIPFRIVNDIGKHKCKKSNKCSIKSSSSQALFNYALPTFSMVALLLLGFTFINPMHYIIADGDAYADDNSNNGIATYATGDTSISMSIQSGAADQKTNAEAGKVAYRTNGIRVTAANVDGYQVFVQASQGSTGTLTNGTTTISGVGNNVAYSNIGDNKWGYALSAGSLSASPTTLSYNTVPESGATASPAYTTDATTETKDFTLAFAAKFASNATAGEYKTNVTLSVAAGAKEVTTGVGFAGYTYMQDLDKTKCESIPVGTEGRLIDKRDNKVYWVARIKNSKDDNALCWMTQNLDYDGGAVAGYSGDDVLTLAVGTSFASGSQNQKYYYSPGDYVYILGPEAGKSDCYGATISTGLSMCASQGWKTANETNNADISNLQDLSGWATTDDIYFVQSTEYVGTDGISICNKEADSWFGNNNYAQCRIYYSIYTEAYEHYSIGNYYNWTAATNGTGSSSTTDGAEASGSICPTGWSLPLSKSSNNNIDRSFYKLMNGLKYAQITDAPYYFVYGGYVRANALDFVGRIGSYWASTVKSSTSAYKLNFGPATTSSLDPSSYGDRYYGYSVRCVAR